MAFAIVHSERFQEHDTGQHVENAGRLRAVEQLLKTIPDVPRLAPRLATDLELGLLHSREYIERLERLSATGGGSIDADTCVSARSAEVARLAVGGSLELVRRVVEGEFKRGMALVRPPGHHATPTRPMGFCLYSNIALAAVYTVRTLGLKRVFVFDWDVHHGNGTQDCLATIPEIQFASFHQWPLYPGSGWYDERGVGNIFNLPLPAGMGDEDYVWALQELVEPQIRRFDPGLILVSAGYDAHRDDPLGGMNVTADGFAQMAGRLGHLAAQGSAQGRVVALLEGGYNPQRLAESVLASIQAWRQADEVETMAAAPSDTCRRRVREAAVHWEKGHL